MCRVIIDYQIRSDYSILPSVNNNSGLWKCFYQSINISPQVSFHLKSNMRISTANTISLTIFNITQNVNIVCQINGKEKKTICVIRTFSVQHNATFKSIFAYLAFNSIRIMYRRLKSF